MVLNVSKLLKKKKNKKEKRKKALLKKMKDVFISSCLAGTVISGKMVIAIGTGVVKASNSGKAFSSLRSKL